MNCITCGGKLNYVNGIYVCENCGTKQQIETIFENIDVFICYVEADEQGRRTKDSVIAQDIYNKLQSANINAFYQRITAGDLVAEDFKKAQNAAMDKAKTIIICASSRENFNKLLDENRDSLVNKNVIPVYASINAYDIPEELVKLQAVNYDHIGAITDLTKNLLRILGRGTEADIANITSEHLREKRKHIIITICSVLTLLILTFTYIVFGTPFVLKSKKYSYAEKLMSNGQYLEAANMFGALENYENANAMIKKIYDRYDGYYNSESKFGLYLNMEDSLNVEIEITHIYDNKMIKASTSAKIVDNVIDFYYRDSEKNQGAGKIELYDDQIKVIVKTEESDKNLTIGNHELYFSLNDKSDSPLFKPIKGDDLISWLEKQISADYIKQLGYELENVKTQWQDGGILYQMKNTNIQLIMVPQYEYESQHIETLYSFSAPASIILQDYVDKKSDIVAKGDFVYVPFGRLESYGPIRSEDYTGRTIEANTIVAVTSKTILNSFGEFSWPLENLIGREIYFNAYKKYGEAVGEIYYIHPEIEAENDSCYLYTLDLEGKDFVAIYKVNKDNYRIEFVGETPCYIENNPYYSRKVVWEDIELIEEFPQLISYVSNEN